MSENCNCPVCYTGKHLNKIDVEVVAVSAFAVIVALGAALGSVAVYQVAVGEIPLFTKARSAEPAANDSFLEISYKPGTAEIPLTDASTKTVKAGAWYPSQISLVEPEKLADQDLHIAAFHYYLLRNGWIGKAHISDVDKRHFWLIIDNDGEEQPHTAMWYGTDAAILTGRFNSEGFTDYDVLREATYQERGALDVRLENARVK